MIKNAGFTLLELLISLTLVSVLLVGVTGLGARFVSNISDNSIKQNEIEDIYSTFHLISQDVASYAVGFTGSLNSVAMLTLQKAVVNNIPKSGQTLVSYRIENNNNEYILYRKIKDGLYKTQGVETQIIKAKEIIFSFIGETLQENPAWIAKSQKSAPVAWKISIKDSAGRIWQRTIPFMVRFNDEQ